MSDTRRGQSEVIGIVLLIGVVTVLVVGVGAVLISDLYQDEERSVAAVESNVTAQTVTLDVRGGDRIPASDIRVILRGDEEYRLQLVTNLSLRRGESNDTFAPGDKWQGVNPIDSGSVTLLVVETSSSAVLHKSEYELG
jgi:flagellin-like protein